MANDQNLILFKKGDPKNKILGAKGGSHSHPAKSLAKRKWCKFDCPLYPCWAQPQSDEMFKGECALKQYPFEYQLATWRFLKDGRKGIEDFLANKLMQINAQSLSGEGISKEEIYSRNKEVLKNAIDVGNFIYPKAAKLEGKFELQQSGSLTINDLKDSFQKYWKKKKELTSKPETEQKNPEGT